MMRVLGVLLGLAPLVAGAAFSDADYAGHVARLRKNAPAGFTIVVEKPFVVIGDESPESVRRWASGTIRWADGFDTGLRVQVQNSWRWFAEWRVGV